MSERCLNALFLLPLFGAAMEAEAQMDPQLAQRFVDGPVLTMPAGSGASRPGSFTIVREN